MANQKESKSTRKYAPSRTLTNVLHALAKTKRGEKPQYEKETFSKMMKQVRGFINLSKGGLNSKGMAIFGGNDAVFRAARTHRKAIRETSPAASESSEAPVETAVAVEATPAS